VPTQNRPDELHLEEVVLTADHKGATQVKATHFYTTSDTEAAAAMANMNATSEGDPFWAYLRNSSQFVPMYRLLHPAKGTHLFTTFIDERDAAVNEEGYQGEGIGFWCMPPGSPTGPNVAQLFRGYDPQTDDHLYSLDESETGYPYRKEGVACLVLAAKTIGALPLWRFRSPQGLHFYTTNPDELLGEHYIGEGACGWVLTSPPGGPQPFYRSYSPVTGGHLYTLSIAEHDAASKNSGYRGDGIACFIWPDGAQPTHTVKLSRAYNSTLDDHLYTTDPGEYTDATQKWSYAGEGVAGWVLSPEVGRFNPVVGPVHRLLGSFGDDFFLLPPGLPASLSNNSNFIITSEIGGGINTIAGLQIDIAVTSDITVESVSAGDLGVSFQLNAVSPEFYASVWQQFVLFLDNGEIICEIQNWTQSPYAVGFIVGSANVCHIGGNTLRAGHSLRISLLNDDYANILGAEFFVYDGHKTIGHHRLLVKDFPNGLALGAAPIVGFQVVVVGPGGGAQVVLAPGGAGLITYTAAVPLCAATQAPSVAEYSFKGMVETAEQSNCVYGEIASTKSKTLTQTFGVGAQTFSLPRSGTPTRMLRRPEST
jgi:hypothetical protein